MIGEIDFTRCGNEATVKKHSDSVDIRIGRGLWLILSTEQALALLEKLKEVMSNERNSIGDSPKLP